MLKNYFFASVTLLRRDISYTLVNMLGLATGMACCILLGLHLQHESSHDRHFSGYENIYRVVGESSAQTGAGASARVYFQVGEQLDRDFAEVQSAVRFTPRGRSSFRLNDVSLYWSDVYVADASVFSVFSHEILQGDPDTALLRPGSIAVSESFARAYFGADASALGQVVVGENESHTVTLVFADLPSNTHLKYDVLLYRAPVDIDDPVFQIDYGKGGPVIEATDYTYVVLPDDYDPLAFSVVSDLYAERHLQRYADSYGTVRYYLEPLADIHFRSTTVGDLPRGSLYFLYSFSGIALLVLLVACANYVNLTTSRFARRDKEIQIRHILGAGRVSLILRFVLEAQVLVFLALPCAILLVAMLMELTPVSAVIGDLQPLRTLLQPQSLALLFGGTCLTGLLSGVYPALQQTQGYFGKVQGLVRDTGRSFHVRQFLLFLQLAISVGVIATTLLMYRQIKFVQDTPPGFAANDRLVLEVRIPADIDMLPALLNTLNAESSILSATYSEEIPGRAYDIRPHTFETEAGGLERKNVARQRVHDSWIESMGIEVIEGRDFTPADFAVREIERGPDRKIVVNETLVRQLGWSQPIGKNVGSNFKVIGVVGDFRFQGPEQRVEPLVLYMDQPRWENKTAEEIAEQVRYVVVHHAPGAMAEAKGRLQAHWREFYPEQPFTFVVLEDFLAGLSSSSDQQLSLIGVFGSLCILIASLGLYSLTAFATEQRSKEIAIRKVMGASAAQIILLFTRGIMKLVILAGILASAVSWWVVGEWLQGFHYQRNISVLVFFIATVLMSLVAVLTIALQCLVTANRNPGLMLRYE